MTDKAIDVFAVEEILSEGDLYHRLANEGVFRISESVSAVVREFIKQVQEETLNGTDLVQFWIEAVRKCTVRGQSHQEFPATAGGSPVFPEVVEFMSLDDPNVRKTALKVYAALDPRYSYTY